MALFTTLEGAQKGPENGAGERNRERRKQSGLKSTMFFSSFFLVRVSRGACFPMHPASSFVYLSLSIDKATTQFLPEYAVSRGRCWSVTEFLGQPRFLIQQRSILFRAFLLPKPSAKNVHKRMTFPTHLARSLFLIHPLKS